MRITLGLFGLLLLVGCKAPAANPDRHLWMFPGIEGNAFWLSSAVRGLRDGGVDHQVHYFDWERPPPGLRNLTEHDDNRRKAEVVATEIEAACGSAPVDLIGYSGGGGMAVFVAEVLAPKINLRRVILVQPALSPDYDLEPTLQRAEVINLYCRSDSLTLGLGTELFGTMDRKYVASAGKNGFDAPRACPDPALRPRLREIAWEPKHLLLGHIGNHIGMLGYYWNRMVVAPLLVDANQPPAADKP